jgi:hypothetical protein
LKPCFFLKGCVRTQGLVVVEVSSLNKSVERG